MPIDDSFDTRHALFKKLQLTDGDDAPREKLCNIYKSEKSGTGEVLLRGVKG